MLYLAIFTVALGRAGLCLAWSGREGGEERGEDKGAAMHGRHMAPRWSREKGAAVSAYTR